MNIKYAMLVEEFAKAARSSIQEYAAKFISAVTEGNAQLAKDTEGKLLERGSDDVCVIVTLSFDDVIAQVSASVNYTVVDEKVDMKILDILSFEILEPEAIIADRPDEVKAQLQSDTIEEIKHAIKPYIPVDYETVSRYGVGESTDTSRSEDAAEARGDEMRGH